MAMNSDRLPLENKTEEHLADSLYLRNQRKSRLFLALLAVILLLSLVLSLWAGSYETPVAELLRGIFGKASDEKINIVVRNVRLPRICTAVAAGAGLGVTGCILQASLNNPLDSSSTLGVLVCTTMPSCTGLLQAVTMRASPSTSTQHTRQAAISLISFR